jgi:hypothetical protein
MASIISAGTTSGTALNFTGDTSGNLELKTGAGANTISIPNVSGTATVMPTGYTLGAGNTTRFKNRIINGDMRIDQRNSGSSVTITNTAANTYTLDRWFAYTNQTSKFSVQQNAGAITPATGYTNYLGVTSLSSYSVGSGEVFVIGQQIEGLNVSDLAWGTANAKPITISFQVYSSLTGTFGGALQNSAQNRAYPFTYTVSSANTWSQVSITIAGDTSGTWLTTNGVGIRVFLGLGCGSTVSGTAGSWGSTAYWSATGAVSVVGTNAATFYITGFQVEVGSTATSFEYVDYSTQLAMCQRYYELIWQWTGKATSSTAGEGNIGILVTKRTTPTMLVVNGTSTFLELGVAVRSFTTVTGGGVNGGYCILGGTSGLTPPNMCVMYSAAAVAASAEL